MKIVPHDKTLEPAIRRFNRRMELAGKSDFALSESHSSAVDEGNATVRRECFIAIDAQSEVRGGYTIRRQPFVDGGKPFDLSFLKFPVSEGIADRRHAGVGVSLLSDVSARVPSCFALGMGGATASLPKLLDKLGWGVMEVPFFFKILRAGPVLATLEPFRRSRSRRLAAAIARFTGLGQTASRIVHPRIPEERAAGTTVTVIDGFGSWVDDIWERSKVDYAILAERSSRTLPLIYAPFAGSFEILRVERNGAPLGWTLCLVTKMRGDRHFGNLTVSTLADGLAPAADVSAVVRASVRHLEKRRPDLILSNQINRHWCDALVAAHFRKGPSNFAWALTPKLRERFAQASGLAHDCHINRGDGDGPIHL